MTRLKVYGADKDSGLLFELDQLLSCEIIHTFNGRYELTFTCPLKGAATGLLEFQRVQVEGQFFRIWQLTKDSSKETVTCISQHVFYDLHYLVLDSAWEDVPQEEEEDAREEESKEGDGMHPPEEEEEEEDILPPEEEELPADAPGPCVEAMKAVLEKLKMDTLFCVGSAIGSQRHAPNWGKKTGAEALFTIADAYAGELVRDNYSLRIDPVKSTVVARIAYKENLISIQEVQQSAKELVTRLYPTGYKGLRLQPKGFLEVGGLGFDDIPLSQHVYFPAAKTQEVLQEVALEYLGRHSKPSTTYRVDCVLFSKEGDAVTVEDLVQVRAGDAVEIEHPHMGIHTLTHVLHVRRDILTGCNVQLELGCPKFNTSEDDAEQLLVETKDNGDEWAAVVFHHINEVFGGTLRNVKPAILKMVWDKPASFTVRKPLVHIANILRAFEPYRTQANYQTRDRVQNPVDEIRRRKYSPGSARAVFRNYIRTLAGNDPTSPSLVHSINRAYERHFGVGTQVSFSFPTVEQVFGEDRWDKRSTEYWNARQVLINLRSFVGNVSELYLELGGGAGGVIGAINLLYDKIANPDVTPIYWAEVVKDYVDATLGGSVRDIDPALLLCTPHKTLRGVCAVLQTFGQTTSEYTSAFSINDPVVQLKQRFRITYRAARDLLRQYVLDAVGGTGRTIVQEVNLAYASVYGQGQQAFLPIHHPFDWEDDPKRYALQIVDLLEETIGNVSGVYLELGGGRTGVVGAINKLYEKLANPELFVEDHAPENSVGKDGDIWFMRG